MSVSAADDDNEWEGGETVTSGLWKHAEIKRGACLLFCWGRSVYR